MCLAQQTCIFKLPPSYVYVKLKAFSKPELGLSSSDFYHVIPQKFSKVQHLQRHVVTDRSNKRRPRTDILTTLQCIRRQKLSAPDKVVPRPWARAGPHIQTVRSHGNSTRSILEIKINPASKITLFLALLKIANLLWCRFQTVTSYFLLLLSACFWSQ